MADGRGGRDGAGGGGEHHLPPRHREVADARGAPRQAHLRLQGPLRQPVLGRGTGIHRRRDRAARDAAEADPRAGDAPDQARRAPEAQAREHPSVTTFRTVRVAAVQATPVILDAEASVHKAAGLIGAAARDGAELVALPETFVSLYPSNRWARAAASFGGADELWERMWESSVEVPGPLVDQLVAACAEHAVHCVIGVNERESERPGTLYNTMLTLGPEGLLAKHRKLMPTHHERLFHGIGAGDDLGVVETPLGRIGGLICWENRMPLARYAVYRSGPQIWVAPNADDSDGWVASMRHIAIESGAYVVSVPQYIPRSAFPDDFPVALGDDPDDVFGRGGAAIVEPTWGDVIAGPLYGEEGMVVADCDLREGLHAKRWFDAVGHYSRQDVLAPARTEAPPEHEPTPG
ncbi:MAG: carbon-nitrogen hydrolase family protein [Actinobacteria bacterium]|nr:MAG: carbon-nitrogen hydrolase family protein [Actinomycetota bacterium]